MSILCKSPLYKEASGMYRPLTCCTTDISKHWEMVHRRAKINSSQKTSRIHKDVDLAFAVSIFEAYTVVQQHKHLFESKQTDISSEGHLWPSALQIKGRLLPNSWNKFKRVPIFVAANSKTDHSQKLVHRGDIDHQSQLRISYGRT